MASFGQKIGFQDNKPEAKIDEDSGSSPVEVHTHDLVSVCLLLNIVKIETFMLFMQ